MKNEKEALKSEAKHTPPPLSALRWEQLQGRRRVYMPQADYVLTTADGQVTGVCASSFGVKGEFPDGIDAKLARLIAAAPDLLAAAKLAYDDMLKLPANQFSGIIAGALRAAIAKAEGR